VLRTADSQGGCPHINSPPSPQDREVTMAMKTASSPATRPFHYPTILCDLLTR